MHSARVMLPKSQIHAKMLLVALESAYQLCIIRFDKKDMYHAKS